MSSPKKSPRDSVPGSDKSTGFDTGQDDRHLPDGSDGSDAAEEQEPLPAEQRWGRVATIALVGRPNVGKSTLFNRLTRSRRALVDDSPGMTRDRQYGTVSEHYLEDHATIRAIRVVDTGGLDFASASDGSQIKKQASQRRGGIDDPAMMREMAKRIHLQVQLALEESDATLLILDARAGLLPDDAEIVSLLRRAGKPFFCVVNKTDGLDERTVLAEFHALGVDRILPVAASHGTGVLHLMDSLVGDLTQYLASRGDSTETLPQEEGIRVALVGCPNAGKSSLVNTLLKEERQIASERAGTTRDSVDIPFATPDGTRYVLVDTAGIRRKSRVSMRVEKFSIIAALKSIDRADVAVLVLDGGRGITSQDKRIAERAHQAGCGMVLVVNKCDLIGSDKKAQAQFQLSLELAFPRLGHVPVLYVSAKTGVRVGRILGQVRRVHRHTHKRIGTGELNRWLARMIERHPPPRGKHGHAVKLRYLNQVGIQPPTFLFFSNRPDQLDDAYHRFLENRLRDSFGYEGATLRIRFKKGGGNPFEQKAKSEAKKRRQGKLGKGGRGVGKKARRRASGKGCGTGGSCRIT